LVVHRTFRSPLSPCCNSQIVGPTVCGFFLFLFRNRSYHPLMGLFLLPLPLWHLASCFRTKTLPAVFCLFFGDFCCDLLAPLSLSPNSRAVPHMSGDGRICIHLCLFSPHDIVTMALPLFFFPATSLIRKLIRSRHTTYVFFLVAPRPEGPSGGICDPPHPFRPSLDVVVPVPLVRLLFFVSIWSFASNFGFYPSLGTLSHSLGVHSSAFSFATPLT